MKSDVQKCLMHLRMECRQDGMGARLTTSNVLAIDDEGEREEQASDRIYSGQQCDDNDNGNEQRR